MPDEQAKPEQPKPKEQPQRKNKEDNVIFVGDKPFGNYITAIMMQFGMEGRNEVIVKSRGKFVSSAVDIAEIIRQRFMKGVADITKIETNSEDFTNKEGRKVRVSTIEITISKK